MSGIETGKDGIGWDPAGRDDDPSKDTWRKPPKQNELPVLDPELVKEAGELAHAFCESFEKEHGFLPYGFHRQIKALILPGSAYAASLLDSALKRLAEVEEALEQLSIGHGVPLAAAMAAPPERYRIMAKELNEMLQERTVFAREALAKLREGT
jgi:hypothetical protein